jgi:hypothetical protein
VRTQRDAGEEGKCKSANEFRSIFQTALNICADADMESVLGLVGQLVADVSVQLEKSKNIKKYQQLFQVRPLAETRSRVPSL